MGGDAGKHPWLLSAAFLYNVEHMNLRLTNADIQAKIDRWVAETGRGPEELVEDAVVAYFAELAETREILNGRYDDLKDGKERPVSGDKVRSHFLEKSASRRSQPGS